VDADTSTLLPKYTAQQFRQGQSALYGGGSGRRLGGRSGFRVDTPSTILTASSTTWTLGPCSAQIDPGATTHQGMYGWATDANVTGTVTAADATNPRKDIVYIQVNDSSAGDGSGALTANVSYLAGTPAPVGAGTPAPPTLPARSFLVGTISVPISGGGSPTVVRNPAVFAAAGAPLPVSSQTERDALVTYDGLTVQRLDLPGRPLEAWSAASTQWHGQVWTSYTPTWGGWISLGSGAVSTGSYMLVGPNLCAVRMKLVAGSGANLGTGALAVTLPFTSASDQSTLGEAEWLGTGVGGGLQKVIISNPPANNQASILAPPAGTAAATSPGVAGYGYGASTEIHGTILYRTA
jgi:hypothetical protein